VKGLSGYRSVVAYVPRNLKKIVAIGPSGTDYSEDNGRTWKTLSGGGYDSVSFVRGKSLAWATGAEGRIGRCEF
jgi:hypothetical protein